MDESLETKESLAFDYRVIRLFIGLIALFLPWVVSLRALLIPYSISWSYYTVSRDIFVGLLFAIGVFLMSYKGHKHIVTASEIGPFWRGLSRYWPGAIAFRIWQREREEDFVGWVGGIAAWVTALNPTAECHNATCPQDPVSTIHYIGAIILFSTTVYFCLVAFTSRVNLKIQISDNAQDEAQSNAQTLRLKIYQVSGWGITAIMLTLLILVNAGIEVFPQQTFVAETFALELFGIAWMAASQYMPGIKDNEIFHDNSGK